MPPGPVFIELIEKGEQSAILAALLREECCWHRPTQLTGARALQGNVD